MNFRSKFLVVNSHDRTVGGTSTSFDVNFPNSPFVGKQVYKITPVYVRFPNSLFNVIKGVNDTIILSGKVGSLPVLPKTIIFEPGFYFLLIYV